MVSVNRRLIFFISHTMLEVLDSAQQFLRTYKEIQAVPTIIKLPIKQQSQ